MTDTDRPNDRHDDRWLTVSAASLTVGVSERRIRRWLAAGKLPGRDSDRGRLVCLDDVRRMTVTHSDTDGQSTVGVGQAPDTSTDRSTVADRQPSELAQALAVIDRLTRENVEIAGRLGFVMAQLEESRARIALLEAPASAIDGTDPRARPWWRIWGAWAT